MVMMSAKYSIIVAGFPGVGKSAAEKNNPGMYLDMESSNYHWIYDTEGDKICNPEWPRNYVDAILDYYYNTPGKIICISTHKDVLRYLSANLVPFYIVAPLTKEYAINRYRERGSSEEFIASLDKNFDNYMNDIYDSEACIVIRSDDYLSNIIGIHTTL